MSDSVVKNKSYIKYPDKPHPRASNEVPFKVAALCKAYNFPTGLPGGGIIGIVELGGGWTQADLDQFSELNGLPGIVVQDVSVDGTTNTPGGDADGEVLLDIQAAAAAYHYCTGKMPTIKVYWASDIAPAVSKAAADECDVISISWGAPESIWGAAAASQMEAAASQATAAGSIILAASGDNDSSDGSPGANVDLPSSAPHVIACGGTTKFSPSPENVWGSSNPNGEGTGGGYSKFFGKVAWQIGAPAGPGRMTPDVAANADPNTGILVVINGQEQPIGGTSAVAPFYAGLLAAINPDTGWISPTLWSNPAVFTDVTSGTNGQYRASVGPDACTGLGVPNGALLAKLLTVATPPPTVPPPPTLPPSPPTLPPSPPTVPPVPPTMNGGYTVTGKIGTDAVNLTVSPMQPTDAGRLLLEQLMELDPKLSISVILDVIKLIRDIRAAGNGQFIADVRALFAAVEARTGIIAALTKLFTDVVVAGANPTILADIIKVATDLGISLPLPMSTVVNTSNPKYMFKA